MNLHREEFYKKDLARLTRDLDAISSDLKTAQTAEQSDKLKTRAEQILTEIEEAEQKIKKSQLTIDKPISQMGALETTLRKIDFQKARKISALLREIFEAEEAIAALLFLERMTNYKGDYCLDEILTDLFECQVSQSSILNPENYSYRAYPIDLSDVTHEASQQAFISKLEACHCDSGADQDVKQNTRFIQKLCQSLRSGDRVLILIKNWHHLIDAPGFLVWFVEEFWKQLIDEVRQQVLPKHGRIRLVGVLAADGTRPDECIKISTIRSRNTFDVYQPIKIPLSNWTVDDVRKWLMDVQKLDRDTSRHKATQIHKDCEGIPISICQMLMDEYGK